MSTPSQIPPRKLAYRSQHRRRSHAEAHAANDASAIPPILAHELVPQNAPRLVDTQEGLIALIAQLRAEGSFAYDSEFIGEHTYRPWVCVIQVATTREVVLIDPLAPNINLMPFWELLSDPAVEKIVHAGSQDLEPAMRHTGRPPANIFDIQIASAFTGMPYPSALGKLVLALTGADLGPGLKFSQWDTRPLSEVQLSYAANDVRYLPLARRLLAEKLAANPHVNALELATEECGALSEPSLYRFEPGTQRLRVRGVESLRSRQLAVLRALLAWRESQAEADNIPPRMLLRDEVVLEMSRHPVKSVQDLDRVKGLPRPVEATHGAHLVQLTEQALLEPPAQTPRVRHFDPDLFRGQIEQTLASICDRCKSVGIEPTIATSKKEVTQFIRGLATHTPTNTRLSRGWRHRLFGDLLPTSAAPVFAKPANPPVNPPPEPPAVAS